MGYSPWGRRESDTTEQLILPFGCFLKKQTGIKDVIKDQNRKVDSCLCFLF